MAPFKEKWIRRFVINETTRHKQGFTIYKVTSMIFLKSSPNTASKVSVWKRYNDFKKLHTDLKILHSTLQIKEAYPPFPKPKFFGRFEAEVVEERRECAVKFLEFVARHSLLFTNDIFVTFFEASRPIEYPEMDPAMRARVEQFVRGSSTGCTSFSTSTDVQPEPIERPQTHPDHTLTFYVTSEKRNYLLSLFEAAKRQDQGNDFIVL